MGDTTSSSSMVSARMKPRAKVVLPTPRSLRRGRVNGNGVAVGECEGGSPEEDGLMNGWNECVKNEESKDKECKKKKETKSENMKEQWKRAK